MPDSFSSKQNWWKSKYLWILLQMQIFCIASIPNWSPNGILIKTPDIHTSVFPSFQIISSWIFFNNLLSVYTCQKYFSLVHAHNVVCFQSRLQWRFLFRVCFTSKIMSRKDDYLPGGIIQTTKPHTSWPWVNCAINCLIQNQILEQKKSHSLKQQSVLWRCLD